LLFSQLPDRPGRYPLARHTPRRREDAVWEAESATRRNIAMAAAALAGAIFASLKNEMLKLSLFFLIS